MLGDLGLELLDLLPRGGEFGGELRFVLQGRSELILQRLVVAGHADDGRAAGRGGGDDRDGGGGTQGGIRGARGLHAAAHFGRLRRVERVEHGLQRPVAGPAFRGEREPHERLDAFGRGRCAAREGETEVVLGRGIAAFGFDAERAEVGGRLPGG